MAPPSFSNLAEMQTYFRAEYIKAHPELLGESDEAMDARIQAGPQIIKYVRDSTLAWYWASNKNLPSYDLLNFLLDEQSVTANVIVNEKPKAVIKASQALISALPRDVGVYMAGGTALVCLGQPDRTTKDLDFFYSEDIDENTTQRVMRSLAEWTYLPGVGGFVVSNDPVQMPLYFEEMGSPQKNFFGAIMPIDIHPRRHFGASGGVIMPVVPSFLVTARGTAPLSLMLCAKLVSLPLRAGKREQDYKDIVWLASKENFATISKEFTSVGPSTPLWTQKWKILAKGTAVSEKPLTQMVRDGTLFDEEALDLWKKARAAWTAQIDIGRAKPICFQKELGSRDYLPKP